VRWCGPLRELAGAGLEALDLPGDRSTTELLALLAAARPGTAALLMRARLAVGDAFVVGPIRLADGDELAVIPPVSGG
jgi:molybdopterin converting factor small subunit